MEAYVDTCVVAAYYWPEPLSRHAQEALRKCAMPAVSPLVEVELCSAMALKVRRGDVDAKTAGIVTSTFRGHLREGLFRIVPLESRQYEMAREWLCRLSTPLRSLDSLHLAAAFTNKLTLLTADKALAQSARHLGVPCKFIS